MKKYNIWILCSLVLYVGLAYLLGQKITSTANEENYEYRIEINRIMQDLEMGKQIQEIDLQTYNYIQHIEFLDASTQTNEEIEQFYHETNHLSMQIQPLVYQQAVRGYVKFIYEQSQKGWKVLHLLIQLSLLLMECFIIGLFMYMKYHLLLPIQQLKELPLALAQGHFRGDIKAVKQPYLKSYLWGMSQLKDALDYAKQRQLRLEKEKKQMLLSLSHDLKTPLNLISLYSKAIAQEVYVSKEEKQQAALKIAEKVTEIETYVDTIMLTSREEILDFPVQMAEFYIIELLHRIQTTYTEVCAMRKLIFTVGNCENCLVKGDIDRYQEVVENVLENALKYGDGRYIHLTFEQEEDCLLWHIMNSGEPVAKQDILHLFDSFYRGSNQNKQSGTGLGLYICKELTHKMDGDIYAQRQADGMCFTIVIRCA